MPGEPVVYLARDKRPVEDDEGGGFLRMYYGAKLRTAGRDNNFSWERGVMAGVLKFLRGSV